MIRLLSAAAFEDRTAVYRPCNNGSGGVLLMGGNVGDLYWAKIVFFISCGVPRVFQRLDGLRKGQRCCKSARTEPTASRAAVPQPKMILVASAYRGS